MFLQLIGISSIGPKVAIGILSGINVAALSVAIVNGDVKTLSKLKGLGKKTTERIVLELNAKLGGESALDGLIAGEAETLKPAIKKEIEEAYEVLVSAGLQKNQAMELAKSNYVDGMTSEQLVVCCFKNMHK